MEMETKIIAIEIPSHSEIITIECFDGQGKFFAKSVGIIEVIEEAMKEAKEDVEEAKELLKDKENIVDADEVLN